MAVTLDEAIAELRRRDRSAPGGPGLPSEDEVADMEALLRKAFHPDYRRFLLEASDVVAGRLEPAMITDPGSPAFLVALVNDADMAGLPADLLPFCQDGEDYYCLTPDGAVHLWSPENGLGETWPSLAAWIEKVWLR